jgi:hypothetical protein
MATNENPLKQFYRVERSSVKLPSRGLYYDDSVVELNDDGEVPIFPMTAADEMQFKNPDALLSGAAIVDVLKSCIPAIKKPRKLLSCDIDALMIGVRHASYGDSADMTVKCPKCGTDNTYSLNLLTLISSTETLDDSYEVVLQGGDLTVFIQPGTFSALLKRQKTAFEGAHVERIMSDVNMTEERRIKAFAATFNKLTKLNFELVNDAIHKIVFTNEEGEVETVTNNEHIADFLRNITKTDVDLIEDKIAEVNKIGIQRTTDAFCTSCENKWEAAIEFNPVNFS